MLLAAALLLQQPLEDVEKFNSEHIYIIQHGESAVNVPDPITGIYITSGKSLEIPLTEKGKEQAAVLGQKLIPKIEEGSQVVICSSTALRAQQTAHEIFHALRYNFYCELDLSYDGLCELGLGRWEGLPKDQDYEQEIVKWNERSAFDKVMLPKVFTGESYHGVGVRCKRDLQAIYNKHASKIIFVVSHNAAMNAMRIDINQEELSKDHPNLPLISYHNCDIMTLDVPDSGKIEEARFKSHSSTLSP